MTTAMSKKSWYHSADADIIARVTYSYEDDFDAAYVASKPTANSKVTYQLILGETGFSNPFFHNPYEEYYVTTETAQLHVTDNFYLPVFLAKSTYQEVQKTDQTYDMTQAKKHCRREFRAISYRFGRKGYSNYRKKCYDRE